MDDGVEGVYGSRWGLDCWGEGEGRGEGWGDGVGGDGFEGKALGGFGGRGCGREKEYSRVLRFEGEVFDWLG